MHGVTPREKLTFSNGRSHGSVAARSGSPRRPSWSMPTAQVPRVADRCREPAPARIKSGLLGRTVRSTSTNVSGICPERTQRTGARPVLVPRTVPRYPCQAQRVTSPSVASGRTMGTSRGLADCWLGFVSSAGWVAWPPGRSPTAGPLRPRVCQRRSDLAICAPGSGRSAPLLTVVNDANGTMICQSSAAGQLLSRPPCPLTRLLRLGVGGTQAAGSRRVPRSTRDSSRLP